MRKLKNFRLIVLSFIIALIIACQGIFAPSSRSTFNLTFRQKQPGNEQIEDFLLEALQQKIERRGYIYKSDFNQARWKLLIEYQYVLAQSNVLTLTAKLSLYDLETKKEVWEETGSASALRLDNLDKLIEPVARSLTYRLPYAPDYGGVGIILGKDLRIVNFSENSPAQRAGLRKSDLITKIDGQAEMDYQKCQQLLCGMSGTRVEITVLRGSHEYSIKVTRLPMEAMDSNEKQPLRIEPLAIDRLKEKLASP